MGMCCSLGHGVTFYSQRLLTLVRRHVSHDILINTRTHTRTHTHTHTHTHAHTRTCLLGCHVNPKINHMNVGPSVYLDLRFGTCDLGGHDVN